MQLNTEELKDTTHLHKLSLEWPVTRLVGQYKSIQKKEMRTITSLNGTLIRPLGKWTRPGHIQQTEPLTPATETFYVKDATRWVIYTSRMATRSNRCDTTYIRQAQLEHPPEGTTVSSIEYTGSYHVRYQGGIMESFSR